MPGVDVAARPSDPGLETAYGAVRDGAAAASLAAGRAADRAKGHVRDLVKPRLRGVIHQYAIVFAFAVGAVLVPLAPAGLPRLGSVVYAVCTVGLFGVSATYHRVTWRSARARTLMKRADHAMIFIFIAATYTPIALTVLHGTERTVVLAGVWGGALLGVTLRMAWLAAPRWATIPLYIALGWAAVAVLPSVLHGAGVAALVLLLVGGLIYTLGAVAYAARRPNPWPGTFGYHEVFHLATVLAASCHVVTIMFAVLASS